MRIAGPDSLGLLLVSRLAAERGARKPITVEDLIETILPYHYVRSALGLTMKGEYDLAVLDFLHCGEYLRVDSRLAEAVERELATPEPDLAFLSELAEARVEVRPEAWAHWSGPTDAGPDLQEVSGEYPAVGSSRPADASGAEGDRTVTPSQRCRHCQRVLPERSDVQFCPYCGAGQADPTCAECDEHLERGWAYCPRCGKATET